MVLDERAKLALVSAACCGTAAIFFLADPAAAWFYPPCPFHALTGLTCPGCGSARALHQLLHGRLGSAFALNPAAVLFVPFAAYAFLSQAALAVRGRRLPAPFIPAAWIRLLLALVIVYWVARNV